HLILLHLFAATPVTLWRHGPASTWVWLLASLAVLMAAAGLAFHRAHRRLYPGGTAERLSALVGMILSPPAMARAVDFLWLDLLWGTHPLAAALAILPADDAAVFARRALRDARHPFHPGAPGGPPEAAEAAAWHRAAMLRAMETALRARGGSPERLVASPEPEEPAVRAWCPRCETQYTLVFGDCAECGGLPLTPFTPPREEADAGAAGA
ncbi:MAG TPA: hypothetical protein VJV23_11190, partial [Candidatus Polarisedimenticolia bacterium]|nr:hypothetical protein [Candidatus Polarisedimenticolia bacterium]